MDVIDFHCLCEQVLLEEAVHDLLTTISNYALAAVKDYRVESAKPGADKRFILAAVKQELKDLRDELNKGILKEVSHLSVNPNIRLQTIEDLDNFIYDKSARYEGLRYLLSKVIGIKKN